MQKIVTYLWYDKAALEAAKFYTALFKNSKVGDVAYYGEGMPMPAGTVLTVSFTLDGQEFVALNGGPEFKFTEAMSLMVNCEDQQEVDELWSKLTADGGEESQCGWLKDKYGLSWQIIPTVLMEMMQDKNAAKAQATTQAMLQMRKIDIPTLKRAFDAA